MPCHVLVLAIPSETCQASDDQARVGPSQFTRVKPERFKCTRAVGIDENICDDEKVTKDGEGSGLLEVEDNG